MVLVVPEQSQRPYRFGMTLLCVGALFNWLGLADTYSEPVPAIRYIGVGLIAAGASLICMAMCFWMRNIHDPTISSEYDVPSDPVHVITIDPSLEKPPDYSTVVDVPPCYEDAIKLNNSASKVVAVHTTLKTTTTTGTMTSTNETSNDISGKNAVTPPTESTERNNSPQRVTTTTTTTAASQPCDECDFSSATRTTDEKCDPQISRNSSQQTENALAKVLRKSIRGIRRLRSSGDENVDVSPSTGTVESGLPDNNRVTTTETSSMTMTKVER